MLKDAVPVAGERSPATIAAMPTPLRTFALAAALAVSAHAQSGNWLPTWAAADMLLPPAATSAKPLPLGTQDVTLRQVVHISQGGKRVRVTFSNEFGTTPLRITAVHLAFLSAGSKILPATDKALTFSGQTGVTIDPGKYVSSDAVVETVPIFSDLVISAAVPAQDIPAITYHAAAFATTFIAAGDQTTALEFNSPAATPPGMTAPVSAPLGDKPAVRDNTAQSGGSQATSAPGGPDLLAQTTSWYFLKDVEVDRTRKSGTVVAFGDSITDGAGSTPETNRRWPDVLAPLLAANKKTAALSIANMGIGGNRILHQGTGPSGLDRFDRDVLSQPGAKFVIMLEGINDIGNMHRAPADAITEQQLIDAYTTLVNRAHAKGIRFIAATITPYNGAGYYSEDGEQIRQHVNAFLRTSKLFDGVVDFDKVIRDPGHPGRMLPKYDHGDHLHPSDQGYAAMGAAINLKLFRK